MQYFAPLPQIPIFHFEVVAMMETIELNSIDIRLEHTRHRDWFVERQLLASIMERDILDPLEVIACSEGTSYVLIDGFKRYRCAKKLAKGIVPVQCIAQDITEGVLSFIRRSSGLRGVSTLEEAALLEELHKRYGLSIYDLALRTGRSPAWVSVRLSMLEGLSVKVRRCIMTGAFPARAYMYGIKGFTRVNRIPSSRVDAFVGATSGKGLSTREIFVLSRAFFTGGPGIEQLVLEGDVHKALRVISGEVGAGAVPQADEAQQSIIKELSNVLVAINRVRANAPSLRTDNSEVNHHVNYITTIILNRLEEFSTVVKELHDRSGPADSGVDALPSGREPQKHCTPVAH